MLTRCRDEEGFVMVTVIMALLVIVSLSVAVYQLSAQALQHSAYDQKRDRALQAAQAAVNGYLAALPGTNSNRICTDVRASNSLSTAPVVSYSVSVTWFDNATPANTGTCLTSTSGNPSASTTLSRLVVTGTGTAGVGNLIVTRKWQSLINLTPVFGGVQDAFFGNNGLCITGGPQIDHYQKGNDAWLYTNGDINTLAQCGSSVGNTGNMVLQGNMYAEHNIDNITGCVEGNVWAGGSVTIQNATVGACGNADTNNTSNQPPLPTCYSNQGICIWTDSSGNPLGNVTAAGGNVTLNGSSTAGYGTCKASGSEVWAAAANCSPNRASGGFAPVPCAGTVGNNTANCGYSGQSLQPPPAQDMPTFTWNSADWTSPPTGSVPSSWAVVTEPSCSNAQTDLANQANAGAVATVFRIQSTCALTYRSSSQTTLALRADTAIVTDGAFNASSLTVTTNATNSCASDVGGRCQFDIIVPNASVGGNVSTCLSSSDLGTWDISFSQKTNLGTVNVQAFTPCQVSLSQQANVNGQLIGGIVNISNNFSTNFVPILVPGFNLTGYLAAPVYFRECVPGSTFC